MAEENYICSNCGEIITGLYTKKESNFNWLLVICLIVVGVILISVSVYIGLLLIIPALFIPMGSKKTKINMCPTCKAENCLVPTSTAKGKQLLQEYYPDI